MRGPVFARRAARSREQFMRLDKADRDALLAFLGSL
jgi:CxxC motif-containing protein (DUF1111 family)